MINGHLSLHVFLQKNSSFLKQPFAKMLDFLQVWPWVVEPNNQQGELLSQFGAVVPHNQLLGKSSHKIHILARSLNKRKKSE